MSMNPKQVLLLGSLSTDDGESQSLQSMVDFMKSALGSEQSGTEVAYCHFDELGFVAHHDGAIIRDLRNNRDLTDYSLVFFRGKLQASVHDAALVSSYLQKHNIPLVNTSYAYRRPMGKIPQMFQMRELGLPIPYTVSAGHAALPALIAEHLEYPVVVKDVHGSHGRDNYLVKSDTELQEILQASPKIRFMAQQCVPNDCDYRVLIIGPKHIIIRRRANGDSHLNNTSQGGSAELVADSEFPDTIVAQARAYAADCHYEMAGVDVIQDLETGEYYFLEINSQPQIASGAFVPEKSALVGEYFNSLIDTSPAA